MDKEIFLEKLKDHVLEMVRNSEKFLSDPEYYLDFSIRSTDLQKILSVMDANDIPWFESKYKNWLDTNDEVKNAIDARRDYLSSNPWYPGAK